MSITDELRREAQGRLRYVYTSEHAKYLLRIADRIDAEHERAMAAAALIAGVPMTDENMAEHGWVRKDKEHIISHAAVEVTPHIDWSRMADELDEFVEIVRGMAGDA